MGSELFSGFFSCMYTWNLRGHSGTKIIGIFIYFDNECVHPLKLVFCLGQLLFSQVFAFGQFKLRRYCCCCFVLFSLCGSVFVSRNNITCYWLYCLTIPFWLFMLYLLFLSLSQSSMGLWVSRDIHTIQTNEPCIIVSYFSSGQTVAVCLLFLV